MTQAERTRMYAANCACCMLAASMRDCSNCIFRQFVIVEKPVAKMIVSKHFAERWTTNPDHYREHFTGFSGEIEVRK